MQKLPIGIQYFNRLRQEGYLYVDKTEQIHKLINTMDDVADLIQDSAETMALYDVHHMTEEITRLTDLATHAGTLTRRAQEGTLAAHQQARRITAAYLTPVVRAGRTMRGPGDQPMRELRLPRKVQFEQLASITNSFADLVEEDRDKFIAAGLAPDIGAQLRKEAADLMELWSTRMSLVNQRIGAIQAAREEAAAGRRLVLLLDSIIAPAVETNVGMQAVWQSLMRLSARARRRGNAPDAPDASELPDVPQVPVVQVASVAPEPPALVFETSDALRAA